MKGILHRISQLLIIIKYYLILVFVFVFRIKKETWLISERGDDARDNGFFLYRYMKKNHPSIPVKYVIKSNSSDKDKIDKEDLIRYRSVRHIVYYISSKYLISTHIQGYSPDFRSFAKLDKRGLLYTRGKKIFLQHGITINNLPELYYNNTKLDLFIAGSYPEFAYIKDTFGYPDEIIKYTGFARYDYLSNIKSNYILYMPTWRKWLFHINGREDFMKTEYYKKINYFLNNKTLNKELEKNNLKLVFYPHYEIQKFINSFVADNKNIIIASKNSYDVSQLLKECNMLITDYSSVFFDVAYLKKPTVYYQFDYKKYRDNHYMEGYFNYRRDGFGPVYDNCYDLVKFVRQSIKANFKVSDKYLSRVNDTFRLRDNNSCKRIYNEIIKL